MRLDTILSNESKERNDKNAVESLKQKVKDFKNISFSYLNLIGSGDGFFPHRTQYIQNGR